MRRKNGRRNKNKNKKFKFLEIEFWKETYGIFDQSVAVFCIKADNDKKICFYEKELKDLSWAVDYKLKKEIFRNLGIFKDEFGNMIFRTRIRVNKINRENKNKILILKQIAAFLTEHMRKIERKERIRNSPFFKFFSSVREFFQTLL